MLLLPIILLVAVFIAVASPSLYLLLKLFLCLAVEMRNVWDVAWAKVNFIVWPNELSAKLVYCRHNALMLNAVQAVWVAEEQLQLWVHPSNSQV